MERWRNGERGGMERGEEWREGRSGERGGMERGEEWREGRNENGRASGRERV